MLVEELNAKGGIDGRKIELIVKDTGGSPEKAVSFAKQLIEEEEVFAIIGPATSGETMAVKTIAEEGKTHPALLRGGRGDREPGRAATSSRPPQKDSHAVLKIFQQMKKMGVARSASSRATPASGRPARSRSRSSPRSTASRSPSSEVYDKAATDLTAEVTKIKAANVQAVLNWSIEPAQAIVIKNARQVGLDRPDLPEPRLRQHQVREGRRRRGRGRRLPGGPAPRRRQLPAAHPQKPVLVGYKKAYEAQVQGGREHVRRPRATTPSASSCSADEGGRRRPGEGARRRIEKHEGVRGHGRRLQLLRRRPQRPRTSTPSRC